MLHRGTPKLKGVFHLLAMFMYLGATPYLLIDIPHNLVFSVCVYLGAIIGHFGASAALHLGSWTANNLIKMRRFDHIMIFVKIAATYYVAIETVLHGINPLVTWVLTIGTCIGIFFRIFFTNLPNYLIGLPYLLCGWSIALDPYIVINVLYEIPLGTSIFIMGGVFYTIGGIIYMRQHPNPWPGYMEYHELFHFFSILGALGFSICIFGYAIPHHIATR